MTEPEKRTVKKERTKGQIFWRYFWLTLLLVSLGYANYRFYAPSDEVAWVSDYQTAQEQAKASGKPVILFFTATWCAPCQIMKRQVWADRKVEHVVNEHFIPVMVDVDDPAESTTRRRYFRGLTPTTVVIRPDETLMARVDAGMNKSEFLQFLESLETLQES